MIYSEAEENNLKTPLEMFYHWEKTNPHGVYFRQPVNGQWTTYTWSEVGNHVRRMATALKAKNYPAGSHIAIISKNCAHWIMADLAIWMAGHVSIPLYPNLNHGTVTKVLEHSEAKMAFVGKLDDWSEIQKGIPANFDLVAFPYEPRENSMSWDELISKHEPMQEEVIRKMDEVATIIYTSGTTGDPKGVVHNFISPSYAGVNVCRDLDMTPQDRFFSYLPLAHVAERLLCETTPLYAGATVSFAESLATFPKNVQDTAPTIFLAVPRLWTKFKQKILLKMPQKKLNILLKVPLINNLIRKKIQTGLGIHQARVIGTGAAAIPESLLRWFKELGINISDCYAMTENFAYSYVSRPEAIKIGCSGQPFSGVDVKLSEGGEVLIKSRCDLVEYYKNPEETEAIFTDDKFIRTGDLADIDSKGYLKITGRAKDIFKTSKGKYVAPTPIEKKLASSVYVEQICVVGDGMPSPLALIVLAEDVDRSAQEEIMLSLEETRKETNNTLDHHEMVSKIIVVETQWAPENGFLTPTMKVKRPIVEKHYVAKFDTWISAGTNVIFE